MLSIKYENTVHQAHNNRTSLNVRFDNIFWGLEIQVDVGTPE